MFPRRLSSLLAAATVSLCSAVIVPAAAQAAPGHARPIVVAAPGEVLLLGNLRCSIGLTGLVGQVRYAVTAGHCYGAGTVLDKNKHPLGQYESYRPDKDDNYGFGLIRLLDNVSVSASMGKIGLTSVDFAPRKGQQICKVGYRTGLSCGSIIDTTSKHILATNGMRDDHGDSGGVVYRQTQDGQAAFVGIIIGYRAADHAAVIEPAKWLFTQIRRYGPTKGSPFTWYRAV